MKATHRLSRFGIAAAALLQLADARAEGLHGELAIAHGYLFRGLELNDSQPGWRAYLEYAGERGLYLGLWAGSYDTADHSERDNEINYLVGYSERRSPRLAWDTALIRYAYPGSSGYRNYDWTEWLSSVHLGSYWSVSYGLSKNWLAEDALAHSLELTFQYPLPRGFVLDLNAGAVHADRGGLRNYHYSGLGLSRGFGDFSLRAAVARSDDRARYQLGSDIAGTHAALQLSWSF